MAEDFRVYLLTLEEEEKAVVNEQKEDYLYWDYTPETGKPEHNRAVKLSGTGVLITSTADKEKEEETYAALKFSIK